MENGESCYRRYLDGDKSGFDSIMDMYHESVVRFVRGYIKNDEDAEDIAAETFLDLLIHPSRFGFRSSLKTYIFSVARHKAIDFARRRQRRVTFDIDGEDMPDIPSEDNVDRAVINAEISEKIRHALGNLHADYAEILYLTYFESLDSDEITRIMKKNKKQLANLLYRAKAAMKCELERSGYTYDEQ